MAKTMYEVRHIRQQSRPQSMQSRILELNLSRLPTGKLFDHPSILKRFTGEAVLRINGKNIFETKQPAEEFEVLDFLYWLQNEQENYTNTSQYERQAPQECKKDQQSFMGWRRGHVLMEYLTETPYVTLQSPDGNRIEIYWDFRDNSVDFYRYKHGKGEVEMEKFLRELNDEKRRMAQEIFANFPDTKNYHSFAFLK